jgi:hypothetical protein
VSITLYARLSESRKWAVVSPGEATTAAYRDALDAVIAHCERGGIIGLLAHYREEAARRGWYGECARCRTGPHALRGDICGTCGDDLRAEAMATEAEVTP